MKKQKVGQCTLTRRFTRSPASENHPATLEPTSLEENLGIETKAG